MAPQLTVRKRPSRRALFLKMYLAIFSLPTPVSPSRSTVVSSAATRSTSSSTSSIRRSAAIRSAESSTCLRVYSISE